MVLHRARRPASQKVGAFGERRRVSTPRRKSTHANFLLILPNGFVSFRADATGAG